MPLQNIIFVTEDEARAYYLPPNSRILLMDTNSPVFYIKSTDNLGQSSIETFDFTKRTPPSPSIYATKDDLAALESRLAALINPQPKEEQHNEST